MNDSILAWFYELAADLDPDANYELPTLELTTTAGSYYCPRQNLVMLDLQEPDLFFTLAHEMRHWQQHSSGRLKGPLTALEARVFVVYRGVWEGKKYEIAVSNQKQYETKLPWEVDANLYATDAKFRLRHSSVA